MPLDKVETIPKGDLLPVLHLVLSLDCGGLEHLVVELSRLAVASGRRVGVACLERPGALADLAKAAGAEVVTFGKQPGIDWGLRRRLADFYAEWKPGVVHTHQVGALFYGGPPARRLSVPVVHTEHGKHYDRSWRLRVLARYSFAYANRYVGVASDVTEHAVARHVVRKRKTATIVNGVDIGKFSAYRCGDAIRKALSIPDTAPVVGTVGRLEPVKNQALLLCAFANVAEQLSDARLLIVGDGTQLETLGSLAGELGLGDRVHFTGYQADAAAYLGAMDVFCLTSDSEGLPLSLLEAMAVGVPVVASAVGGVPGVVRDDESGRLFPRGDIAAAAGAIKQMLVDRNLAHRFSREASKVVNQQFSLDTTAMAYDKLYEAVAAGK